MVLVRGPAERMFQSYVYLDDLVHAVLELAAPLTVALLQYWIVL
jgi:hypothetical protein